MRIRGVEIDPVVVLIAAAVVVFGSVLGLGAGALVAGAAVAAVALGSRYAGMWIAREMELPLIGAPERALLMRSLEAAKVMKRLVRSIPNGPVKERCREMQRQASTALPTVRDLVVQAYRVRRLAEGIPVERLERERTNIVGLLGANPAERTRIEVESSLRSTEAQLQAGVRLSNLSEQLVARSRALTASIEAVTAGIAELQALGPSDPAAQPDVALANLSREIDALRGGLEEAQTLGRQAAAINLLEV